MNEIKETKEFTGTVESITHNNRKYISLDDLIIFLTKAPWESLYIKDFIDSLHKIREK